MFSKILDAEGFPKKSALEPSEVDFKLWTDEILWGFGTIKIQVTHSGTQELHPIRFPMDYTENEVIAGHPTFYHLSLPKIKCNNKLQTCSFSHC